MRCPKCGGEHCQVISETTSKGKIFQLEKVVAERSYWDQQEFYVEPVGKESKLTQQTIGFAKIVAINLKYDN